MQQKYIGKAISRVDGPAKVTGTAKYAAEYNVPDLHYGYVVNSTIANGEIEKINLTKAAMVDGVVKIYTHENRPSTAWLSLNYADMDAPPGKPFVPMHNNKVVYNGQPIAMVVAKSFEVARYAASLITVEYKADKSDTDLVANLQNARDPKKGLASFLKPPPPKPKGNAAKAYEAAPLKAGGSFYHGVEHHNPMEPFATTVVYEDKDKLKIYDKTQGSVNTQMYVANVFGLKFKDVRVLSPFVGGAFGSGLRPQYQLFLSVMAALDMQCNVRLTLNRHQMFTFGHRPATLQNTFYGADADGKLQSIQHESVAETSTYEDYTEIVVNWANMIYPSPNVNLQYKLAPLNMASPMDMRAPGGATGMHPVEITIDELAHQAGMDPVEFRLLNYTDEDETTGKPYSSKELKECFKQAAEKFGWAKRNPQPRSMRRGHKLVGWGMATGIWEAMQVPTRAEAILTADGKLTVRSATADFGTGTYTVMAQIAADAMGMSLDNVTFELGDSDMPFAPISGGSFTAASCGTAVQAACLGLKKKLLKKAQSTNAEYKSVNLDDIAFVDGQLQPTNSAVKPIAYTDLAAASKNKQIASKNMGWPQMMKQRKYTRAAHSAIFAEVEVDEDFGVVKVTRLVSAIAAGKILNPKTARSQILGGMVWGISKALREESVMDHRIGRFMNTNLGEYHTPVNADIHQLDVIFVEEDDQIVNDLGIKGIGEIGLVGVPPAIANAIFHATGKRVRNLPIKLNDLM
ncbi:xanthine dehydrogenase family protein molybdopterin-binding subunit [Mucilaginibacter pallidiroseus]|uniref:Xanthine dehydrogenase family protein molybdopterin-binding subunit n=1 Tax=Mucilaginibacter pallidiroseus TaxID=2599295 RepID=A0A563UCF5_9SPHI|nr:xanthine dehydrogenase family protein molybdopterin-binding subunit [Mucilaginibacter pallidiroseus]TWR28939.1 xanthine dehydrogenase family protein molybdopterin-binding subunit [Mucilaginibacter pallidiroseus]